MFSPNQQSADPIKPISLEEIKRTCDVIEGYLDLNMFDEALVVMGKLSADLRISIDLIELYLNVILKTHRGMLG